MNRLGQCWDNGPKESFLSSLKNEYEEALEFTGLDGARSGLLDYSEIFYNRERMHSGDWVSNTGVLHERSLQ